MEPYLLRLMLNSSVHTASKKRLMHNGCCCPGNFISWANTIA